MKFKRILSLIIALSILTVSNSVFVSAQETATENTKEIEFMIGLGLMSADENGDFHPDSPFTRAEMAGLAVNTIEYLSNYAELSEGSSYTEKYYPWTFFEGATDFTSYVKDKLNTWEAENAETGEVDTDGMTTSDKLEAIQTKVFDDVEVSSSDYENINKVSYYGIMNGYDDGTFKPSEYITSMEAAAAIINMLGYRQVIPYIGGYPNGYKTIASNIRLSIPGSDKPITRKQMAKLFCDALDINIVTIESIGSTVAYSDKKNATILSEFMKLAKVEGRIVQNGQTSLTGKSTLGGNGLQVGSETLHTNDKTEYAQNLIGRNVECYYFNNDTDRDGEVVYVSRDGNDNEMTIDINDFVSYKNNKIEYDNSGRTKKCNISANPLYIYNGLAVTSCPASLFDGSQGSVTLVSNGNTSTYELIIIENYKSKLVKRAYDNNGTFTIVNTLANNDVITFDTDSVGSKVKIFTADGAVTDTSAITADTVIDVMQNGDVIKIIVSDNVLYDFNAASIRNGDTMTISNGVNEYEVSKDYTSSTAYSAPKANLPYDMYLNSFGKIAYISSVGNSGTKIAYLMEMSIDRNEEKVYARIVTGDKTVTSYELADKITFSGTDGTVENKKIKSVSDYNSYLANASGQVVRYSVDKENKLSMLELPLNKGVESKSDDRLYVMAESSGDDADYTYYYADGTLGRKVYMEADTPILAVPTGTTDANKYRIVSYTSLTKGSRKMTAYGTNKDSALAKYVLYFDEASQSYTTGDEYIVCDVYDTINEENEIVTAVEVFRRGTKSRLYIPETSDLANGILPVSLAVKKTSQGIEPDDYLTLGKGDVISCTTDMGNNITTAAVIFDADGSYDANRYKDRWEATSGYDADKFVDFNYDFTYLEKGILAGTVGYWNQYISNTNPFSTDYTNGPVYMAKNNAYGWHMGARRFYLGYVYSVADNYVTVTTKNLRELGEPIPEGTYGEEFLVEAYEIGRLWNYADISGKTVTTGMVIDNPDCIKSYKEYGSMCSRVLVCSGSTAVNEVFVINGNIE